MTAIIEATGLRKTYGDTHAMDGLDLVAQSGCLTALLGPNGAGKTTLISAVATLVKPDAGTLLVGGIDAVAHPQQVRPILGLAGQYASVEPAMTGRENIVHVGRLFGLSRSEAKSAAADVLAKLGLTDAADRLVRTYSGGMRRRLDLGASLVGSPRLLLLDEPTTGLDPGSRLELWDAIRELVAGGTDVLLTTQYLEEAEQLADSVAVIDEGRVIATGTVASLKASLGATVIEVSFADPSTAAAALPAVRTVIPDAEVDDLMVLGPVTGGAERAIEVIRALDAARLSPTGLTVREPSLDDVFLQLTGHTTAADTDPDLAPAETAGARR